MVLRDLLTTWTCRSMKKEKGLKFLGKHAKITPAFPRMRRSDQGYMPTGEGLVQKFPTAGNLRTPGAVIGTKEILLFKSFCIYHLMRCTLKYLCSIITVLIIF